MKHSIFFTLLVIVFISGCSVFKPKMSDDLKGRLNKLLEDGSQLNAMAEQGVSFNNFSQQLAIVKGDYDLASANWPDNIAPEAKVSFDKAFEGWGYVDYLWNAKIQQLDPPVEPNINKYATIVAYAGKENLSIKIYGNDTVPQYQGKSYLPFDENISILLSISDNYYKNAQSLILKEMN